MKRSRILYFYKLRSKKITLFYPETITCFLVRMHRCFKYRYYVLARSEHWKLNFDASYHLIWTYFTQPVIVLYNFPLNFFLHFLKDFVMILYFVKTRNTKTRTHRGYSTVNCVSFLNFLRGYSHFKSCLSSKKKPWSY